MGIELETTFNTVCEEYDRWRPGYVKELYDDIFRAIDINSSSRVLEVGIGTGQATLPILKKGCSFTAIELGAELAEFSRYKFKDYDNFQVNNEAFEDFHGPSNSYDLIFSATAFHWIPEDIGYSKVFDMLKRGGVFARFANHPFKDKKRDNIDVEFKKIYEKYMQGPLGGNEYNEDNARNIANIASKYGFKDISYSLYHRTRSFTADGYIGLLGTYSDNIAMEERFRNSFFGEIKKAINDNGGIITMYDTIDLELARKL